MDSIKDIIGDYDAFLQSVFSNLERAGIDVTGLMLDHIAYRTGDIEKYKEITGKLIGHGKMLSELVVRGRPIAIIKLKNHLTYKDYDIPCLEVIPPAEGDSYPNGLEHAEFVINDKIDEFIAKYPHVKFINKALDRKVNPELVLKFENNANVKFHLIPVQYVVIVQDLLGVL